MKNQTVRRGVMCYLAGIVVCLATLQVSDSFAAQKKEGPMPFAQKKELPDAQKKEAPDAQKKENPLIVFIKSFFTPSR